MQKEHISVILSLARENDQEKIKKIMYFFKRNLLISNYNVLSLKGNYFKMAKQNFMEQEM